MTSDPEDDGFSTPVGIFSFLVLFRFSFLIFFLFFLSISFLQVAKKVYNYSLATLSESRKQRLESVDSYAEDLSVMQQDTFDSQETDGLSGSQDPEVQANRIPDIEVPVMSLRLLRRPVNVPLMVLDGQQLLRSQSSCEVLVGLFLEVKDHPALGNELLTSGWLLNTLKRMTFKVLATVPTAIFNYLFNRGQFITIMLDLINQPTNQPINHN